MSKFRCSICGREIEFRDIAYIRQSTVVCKDCMPKYYVRYVCTVVNRRMRGEQHPACIYCKYYDECTRYINNMREDSAKQ